MPSVELPSHVRGQWPWAPRFTTVNGWRMHYIDEGAGNPVVLLHGNPRGASSTAISSSLSSGPGGGSSFPT